MQAALCLWVSIAWIGLPALHARARARHAQLDAEAPLLSRPESFVLADPTASTLFLAALVSFLGGCIAGLVGMRHDTHTLALRPAGLRAFPPPACAQLLPLPTCD